MSTEKKPVEFRRAHDEVRSHFNEPVLVSFHLARIIGYAETGADSYLIVAQPENANGRWRSHVYWHTMVGGYVYLDRLKGQNYVKSQEGEDWDDLFRLDKLLHYNGCPKMEEFQIILKPDDMEF